MTLFWILSLALLLLCAVFLFYPVWSARRYASISLQKAQADRIAQNVEIFQDRLSELETELSEGKLSDEQFTQLKSELEASLLSDADSSDAGAATDQQPSSGASQQAGAGLAAALFAVVAIASFILYFEWGEYEQVAQRIDNSFTEEELAQARQSAQAGDMNSLLAQLQAKLEQNPENLEGWSLLARSAMNLEDFALAEKAFLQVAHLLEAEGQSQAAVFGLIAQARFFGSDGGLTDSVQEMLDRALAMNPDETYSLGLLAIDAFDKGRFELAISYWQRILKTEPQHPSRGAIESAIVRAKQLIGIDTEQQLASQNGQSSEPATGNRSQDRPETIQAQITVTVSMDEGLLDQVSANDTVFIFARAPDGPPLPLAASRHSVSELPVTVVLDDSKAMAPMAKLSNVQAANVVARVSKSGQPIAAAGDLQGSREGVSVSENAEIDIRIDTVL